MIELDRADVAVVRGRIDDPATNHGLAFAGPRQTDGLAIASREATDPADRPC